MDNTTTDLWLGSSGPCPLVYDGPESGPSRDGDEVIFTIRRTVCGVRKHIYMSDADVKNCRNEREFRDVMRYKATCAENLLACQCPPTPGRASAPWVEAFWTACFDPESHRRVFA